MWECDVGGIDLQWQDGVGEVGEQWCCEYQQYDCVVYCEQLVVLFFCWDDLYVWCEQFGVDDESYYIVEEEE